MDLDTLGREKIFTKSLFTTIGAFPYFKKEQEAFFQFYKEKSTVPLKKV